MTTGICHTSCKLHHKAVGMCTLVELVRQSVLQTAECSSEYRTGNCNGPPSHCKGGRYTRAQLSIHLCTIAISVKREPSNDIYFVIG